MTDHTPPPFRLGWEEWCALPDLGLPALKAKVDTGARTSALHAFDIEAFGDADAPQVRFSVHPVPGRHDLVVRCTAPVLDRRPVTSSNGETEYRFVISAEIEMGARRWPLELTLTDRGAMAYRMLLGRQAIADDMVVAPNDSFCQPVLSDDIYEPATAPPSPADRRLSVAVLTRNPRSSTLRRLQAEAERRGHSLQPVDTLRCYMTMNALSPEVHCDGAPLPRFDAVIPRIGASAARYGAALVRQFETIGTHCLNPSQGIAMAHDSIAAHQVLARAHVAMPPTAFAASPRDTAHLIGLVGTAPLVVKLLDAPQGEGTLIAETPAAAQAVIGAIRGVDANVLVQDFIEGADPAGLRCLVLGGKVVAAVARRGGPDGPFAKSAKPNKAERDAARRAVRAFRLGLASVEMLRTPDGPKVLSVNPTPAIEPFETATGTNIAALLFDLLEKRLRPLPRKFRKPRTT